MKAGTRIRRIIALDIGTVGALRERRRQSAECLMAGTHGPASISITIDGRMIEGMDGAAAEAVAALIERSSG